MVTTQRCKQCGAEFSSGSSLDNCPSCLMDLALSTEEDHPASQGGRVRTFGDYEILRQIGRGGMGIVFMAQRLGEETKVALKVLREELASPRIEKRFFQEVETAANLNHPNIIPIEDMGEVDGQCYFAMKLIEGTTLDQEIGERGYQTQNSSPDQPPDRAAQEAIVRLLIHIARTVHHAHRKKIIHRDLKPSNILLNKEGEPFLTDFGLAKFIEEKTKEGKGTTRGTLTLTGEILGTLEYMSPEQASGQNRHLTSATDIYSLGIILYKMLTGRTPFAKGLTPIEIIKQVTETPPEDPRQLNPLVDRDLALVCLKCLEKQPERRYVSAEALAQDLERWLRREPVLARPPGPIRRLNSWVKQHPISSSTILFLSCLLTVVAIMMGVILNKNRENEQLNKTMRDDLFNMLDNGWEHTAAPSWDIPSDKIAIWNGNMPFSVPDGWSVKEFMFAVYSWKKPTKMLKIFAPVLGPLETQLSSRLGMPVKINFRIYRTYEAGQQAMAGGDIDLARLSPATYVEVKKENPHISLLAMENGKGAGCVFVSGKSKARSLPELKGELLGFVDDSSTGGNYLPKYKLHQAGLRSKDFQAGGTNYLGSHDSVIEGVTNGTIYAGAANRNEILKLVNKGADLVILAEHELQVGKPWVARQGLDTNVANAIRAFLFSITDTNVLDPMGNFTTAFVPAQDHDYDELRRIMEASKEFDEMSEGESEIKLALTHAAYTNLLADFERSGYNSKPGAYQTNYYFDTPSWDLQKLGINLRFRLKGDKATVTVKFNPARLQGPSDEAKDVFENVEHEAEFQDGLATAQRVLNGEVNLLDVATEELCRKTEKSARHPITFLKDKILPGKISFLVGRETASTQHPIPPADISIQAHNATLRTPFMFPAAGMDLKLDLDNTFFPQGYVGYELELEIPSDATPVVRDQVWREIERLFLQHGIRRRVSKLGKTATTFTILRGDTADVEELLDYGQIFRVDSR